MSGNLADIVLTDLLEPVVLLLSVGATTILTETYRPFAGSVTIKLREIVHNYLEVSIPDYLDTVYHQTPGYATFSVDLISGVSEEEFDFTAIKGFLQRPDFDVELFVRQNWLTFQPRDKRVEFHDPEWLTCYPLENSVVRIEATFADETTSVITYASLEANKLQSVKLQPGEVMGLFPEDPVSYKVWVEVSGQKRQYEQKYIIDTPTNPLFNDVFVFENRFGGVDTIRFTGQKRFNHGADIASALFDEYDLEYYAHPELTVDKNTGFFKSEKQRLFALDFFRSINKYHVFNGRPARILTSDLLLESIPGQLASYSFSFQYSDFKDNMPEYGDHNKNILIF